MAPLALIRDRRRERDDLELAGSSRSMISPNAAFDVPATCGDDQDDEPASHAVGYHFTG
jgi:hypothetical protein